MGTASSKLWDGVQANDPIEVISAIKAGADPNVTMQFRRQRGKYDSSETPELTYEIEEWTPLHFACDRGYSQVAYVLLQNGADITKRVYTRWATTMGTKATYEQMAIHLAAKNGHREVLEVLLARSPEHCGINEHDFSCEAGDISVQQRTSANNLASLIPSPPLGYTPLHLAALHGARQLVELLLFHGAMACAEGSTPIYRFPKGWSARPGTCTTPLGIALRKGDTDNALLMAHGTEISDPILVHLCMRGQIECAEFLVQNGSGASNSTLLRRTCANAEQNKTVLAFMCKHYLQMENTHPNSMLFEACVVGKVGMVQYLLENATEKDLTDCRYNRLIIRAPGRQQAAVLTDNVTPLHGAAWGGFAESVALLLLGRKGKVCYGVDSASDGSVTPLHVACILGHTDVALALVRYGADISRTTTISFEDTDQLPRATEDDPSSYTLPAPDSVTTADLTARATRSNGSQGSPVTSRLRLVLNPILSTTSRQPGGSDTAHDTVQSTGAQGETRSHLVEGPPRNALELAAAFGHASLVELLTEGDNSSAAQSARSMAAQRQQARKVDSSLSPNPQSRSVRRIGSRDRVATLERTFSGASDTWNGVDGLQALLAKLDLSHLQESLRSENINDAETLRLLTRQDLRDLGLKIGDVRRLMRFLNMPDDPSSGLSLQPSDSWQGSPLSDPHSGGIPRVGSEPGLGHLPQRTRARSASKEASSPSSGHMARRTMVPDG